MNASIRNLSKGLRSMASISFQDGELKIDLPTATVVYYIERYVPFPKGVAHVDWAWEEMNKQKERLHVLCELKDPESRYGLEDPSGVANLRTELAIPGAFSDKLKRTIDHHAPSQKTPRIYIILLGIEALTEVECDTAQNIILRDMEYLGTPMEAVHIVNIKMWNDKAENKYFSMNKVSRVPTP